MTVHDRIRLTGTLWKGPAPAGLFYGRACEDHSRMRSPAIGPAPAAAATTLAALGGLHVLWGTGSTFPAAARTDLADTVAGSDVVPGPAACFAVAGALFGAAGVVLGAARTGAPLPRAGAAVVVTAFAGRAVLGFTGATALVAPGGTTSARFRRLDRRVYAPLCAAIALASLPAAVR